MVVTCEQLQGRPVWQSCKTQEISIREKHSLLSDLHSLGVLLAQVSPCFNQSCHHLTCTGQKLSKNTDAVRHCSLLFISVAVHQHTLQPHAQATITTPTKRSFLRAAKCKGVASVSRLTALMSSPQSTRTCMATNELPLIRCSPQATNSNCVFVANRHAIGVRDTSLERELCIRWALRAGKQVSQPLATQVSSRMCLAQGS